MAMVMNLDKCIGCHTCSVTCKQAWTNRPGTEYVWFNNVETRPGQGYPRRYEDQETWKGGWTLNRRGNLVLKGGLGFAPASVVSGVGHCLGHPGTIGIPGNKWDILTSPTSGAPLVTDIFNYKTGYKWAGGSYNADVIDAASTPSWGTYSPTASASNPAHIFYVRDSLLGASGTFQLNSNVVINGTLIVDGNLNVRGSGITITPVTSAYPALIVTGTMDIAQKQKVITVNGTCYIGAQLKSTTIQSPLSWTEYSKLTVNGGLLIGANSGSPLPFLYNIRTDVNYNAASPPAPIQLKVPKGLTVLRWGLPYTSD